MVGKVLGILTKKSVKRQLRLWFVLKTYFKGNRTKISLTNIRIVSTKGPIVEALAPLSKFYYNKKESLEKIFKN